MVGLILDSAVLIGLLKLLTDDDIGFGTAFLVSFVTALGTAALVYGLGSALGPVGILLAVVLAAVGLGLGLFAQFGVELKRALMIGGVFMAVKIALSVVFAMLLR